jgi:hypothetical protein
MVASKSIGETMNVNDYMKQMKRGSKKDDLPGAVDRLLDEKCPACGKTMKLYRPCCGSPQGFKGCPCGFKVNISDSGDGSIG